MHVLCQLVEHAWMSRSFRKRSRSMGWHCLAHWLRKEGFVAVCNLHSMRLICHFLWNRTETSWQDDDDDDAFALEAAAWSALWPWRVNKLIFFLRPDEPRTWNALIGFSKTHFVNFHPWQIELDCYFFRNVFLKKNILIGRRLAERSRTVS